MNGLARLAERNPEIQPRAIEFFAHGTTVATNALLEEKGTTAGLIINKGMNAIYELHAGKRLSGVDLVDIYYTKPSLLIPQKNTIGVEGRIAFDGSVVRPLDEDAVRDAVRRFRERGIQSVAVCLIFSFMNPTHEERIAAIFQEDYPGCRLSLSSRILPTIREYPRMSTTVLDAYIGPIVEDYFRKLEAELHEVGLRSSQVYVMQSNGGLMRLSLASSIPTRRCSRPSGRRGVRCVDRALERSEESRHLRHGWHEYRHQRLGRRSLPRRARCNQPARHRNADARDQYARRRRQHDRGRWARRLTQRWPGERGRRSGPRVLWPGRYAADRHRREHRARVPQRKLVPRRGDESRSGARRARHRDRRRRAASSFDSRRGGRNSPAREHEDGDRLACLAGRAGDGSAPVSFGVASAAPDRSMRRPSPPAWDPARRRSAISGISCAMGLLQTDVKHNYFRGYLKRLADFAPDELERLFDRLVQRAVAEAALENFDESALHYQRQLDIRYPHQGYWNWAFPVPPGARRRHHRRAAARHSMPTSASTASRRATSSRGGQRGLVSTAALPILPLHPWPPAGPPTAPASARSVIDEERRATRDGALRPREAPVGRPFRQAGHRQQMDSTTFVPAGQSAVSTRSATLIIDNQSAGGA